MRWIGTGNWGLLLLGIWLVVTGLMFFVQISFVRMDAVLSILALVAGIFILIGR